MSALQDRVIAVTGGAGGIGAGIARAILEAGGRVGLIDLDQGKVDAAALELDAGDRVAGFAGDVTDPVAIGHAMERLHQRMGGLHGLVNNAGVVRLGPADEVAAQGLDAELAVNVKGVLLTAQAAARHFSNGGAIVNIASNAGKVGYRNMAGYNASKAAVISLTRSLSLEWAEKGINVNAVCPGGVATDMLKTVANFLAPRLSQDSVALFGTMVPAQLGRHIQPIEVGRVIAFLLSDAAAIIRGQSISIDGGDTPF
jgi:NAD(P)-dependent dehydrogenase (short-subunit alcohol dehydrogenase family)